MGNFLAHVPFLECKKVTFLFMAHSFEIVLQKGEKKHIAHYSCDIRSLPNEQPISKKKYHKTTDRHSYFKTTDTDTATT